MITKIKIKNWKSYLDEEFNFSRGVNVLLGEMGSGKSSAMDAICFCFFGTIPAIQSRSIKLENLVRRVPEKARSAELELEFVHNGSTYTIRREINKGRSTASLRKDGKLLESPNPARVNELLAEILKIDYELFSRAIYSEQNNIDYFLNLSPADRKRRMDELLKLDRFENARKNGTTLLNDLERTYKVYHGEVERLQSMRVEEAHSKIVKEISEINDVIKNLLGKIKEAEARKGVIEKKIAAEEEKKKKYDELNIRKVELNAKIESIRQEKDKLGAPEMGEEEAVKVFEEMKLKKREFEIKRAYLSELRGESISYKKRLGLLESEISALEGKLKEVPEFNFLADKLKNSELEMKKLEERIAHLNAEQSNLKNAISSLEKSGVRCEVCDSILEESKKEGILKEKKNRFEEIASVISELSNKKISLEEEIERMRKMEVEVAKIEGMKENLENKKTEFGQIKELLAKINFEISELERIYGDKELGILEERIKNAERHAKYFELEKSEKSLVEELNKVVDELDLLKFSEEHLKNMRNEEYGIKAEIMQIKEKISAEERILNEKEERRKELEKFKSELSNLREKLRVFENARNFMGKFLKALEITQVQLREKFLEDVNSVMSELWPRIYPYEDLNSIKLDPNNYGLMLRNTRGEWINANSEVSGGERQCAALTLRVAYSLILAPQFRMLILDEPTHNLDSKAIEELADTLRNGVSGLLDQLFLITHEERLESAATGKIYRLRKKETSSGLTEVEEAFSRT